MAAMSKSKAKSEGKAFRAASGAALLLACIACAVFAYSSTRIKESSLNAFLAGSSSESQKKSMARTVLINTGKWRAWGTPSGISISARLVRIKDRQKDALVIVNAGKGKTIVAVYEKNGKSYTYSGLVGTYQELVDIQVLPMKDGTSGIIVVRDRADRTLEAMEDATYIRAYIWEDGLYRPVLDLLEKYEAYHNELEDQNKPADESKWLRLRERSDIVWENADNPIIHVLVHQNYSLSKTSNQRTIPASADFELVRNRDVLEEYVWSPKWVHFILFEGVDSQTGEPVAIIEDLSGGPLGLLDQYRAVVGRYKVKYLDGTISTVDKERIKPSIKVKGTRVIYNYPLFEADI
jgi:hypothetical protein